MPKESIRSIIYKKYRVETTDSAHEYPVAKNLLNQEFTAEKPGQKWVSDMDLPQCVHLGAVETSVAAWRMAFKNRPIADELLFHSDRGVQYACSEFRDQLKGLPVVQSMGRQGCRPPVRPVR